MEENLNSFRQIHKTCFWEKHKILFRVLYVAVNIKITLFDVKISNFFIVNGFQIFKGKGTVYNFTVLSQKNLVLKSITHQTRQKEKVTCMNLWPRSSASLKFKYGKNWFIGLLWLETRNISFLRRIDGSRDYGWAWWKHK